MYSSVIFVLAWPAILLASMLLPPTSCRHVMVARRRRECGPKPGKSQPSAVAALFSARWEAVKRRDFGVLAGTMARSFYLRTRASGLLLRLWALASVNCDQLDKALAGPGEFGGLLQRQDCELDLGSAPLP